MDQAIPMSSDSPPQSRATSHMALLKPSVTEDASDALEPSSQRAVSVALIRWAIT